MLMQPDLFSEDIFSCVLYQWEAGASANIGVSLF